MRPSKVHYECGLRRATKGTERLPTVGLIAARGGAPSQSRPLTAFGQRQTLKRIHVANSASNSTNGTYSTFAGNDATDDDDCCCRLNFANVAVSDWERLRLAPPGERGPNGLDELQLSAHNCVWPATKGRHPQLEATCQPGYTQRP